jgi:flagellar basal-body rod protein FlgG
MTSSGALLQPPVTLPRGVDPAGLSISSDGRISAGNRAVGRLTLVDVAAPEGLRSAGDNLFEATAQSGAPRAAGAQTTVAQGALEASNVDMGDAMVDLMDSQRSFQMASKALETQDQMWSIANGLKGS